MGAACMPPEQEEMEATNIHHIPPEIVVEILLNLPGKSLLRFSCVSNSWNSMISESGFIKRHHGRATLPGRERMVINSTWCNYLNTASTCPLSSISSDHPIIKDATQLICPFQGNPRSAVHLHASCDELWCVEVENSLFLWNPSMRTYRKLPDSSPPRQPGMAILEFIYGLGYDSDGDDYKILKFPKLRLEEDSELYSLRSDSWRKIDQPFPGNSLVRSEGVFVSGALHWMIYLHHPVRSLISFDLSTEKYGEVAQPEYSPMPQSPDEGDDKVEVTVLRGMLCVCLNYYRDTRLVLWVMEDYGIGKSWTKMFDIDYYNAIPYFLPPTRSLMTLRPLYFYDNGEILSPTTLRPLYFYDNGEILINVHTADWNDYSEIFIYKDEKTIPKKIVGSDSSSKIFDGFLYVESLISPALWPRTAAQVVGNNEA